MQSLNFARPESAGSLKPLGQFMPDRFTTEKLVTAPLTRRHIDQAYPLVQLAFPSTDLRRWRIYARWHLSRPAEQGIMAVWDNREHIFALANFRRQIALEHGPILVSDQMISVDMVNPGCVSDLLYSALTRVADTLGCHQLKCTMDRPGFVR